MQTKRAGRQTVQLSHPPSVVSFANIGGRMEGQGPLSDYFDELSPDAFFGKKTWEQGESAMQERVLRRALEKGGLTAGELDYVLAGDLLNQCIGTSFGLRLPYPLLRAVRRLLHHGREPVSGGAAH